MPDHIIEFLNRCSWCQFMYSDFMRGQISKSGPFVFENYFLFIS